jgi:hypothetical protein
MVHAGKVMHAAVAQQLGLLFTAPELALA